jgi:hypothetical protein
MTSHIELLISEMQTLICCNLGDFEVSVRQQMGELGIGYTCISLSPTSHV